MKLTAGTFHTITRKELAALANSTYESVVRTLSEFQEKGLITLDRKKVRINDMDQLCRLGDLSC